MLRDVKKFKPINFPAARQRGIKNLIKTYYAASGG